jgi:hypothetical protein
MANEQNLKPFEKGVSGNPNGRPKGVTNSKVRLLRILEMVTSAKNPVTGELEDFTIAEQLDIKIIAKAMKGDIRAYQELLDRLEGRAKQTNEIEVSGGLNVVWEEKKTYVENKGSL